MKSRWSEQEAAGLEPLELLVYQSRLVGAEPSLVLWGGGNTSLKVMESDLLGRPVQVLRVKGTGSDLRTIGVADFPGVRLEEAQALFERSTMSDEEMVAYLARCLVEPGSPRPSIETLLHAFLPARSVVHTHADAILTLTNTRPSVETVCGLYGRRVLVAPYRRPGFALSKEVGQEVRESPEAEGLVLMNHGLITWHDSPREAYEAHVRLVSEAEEFARSASHARSSFGRTSPPTLGLEARRSLAARIAPLLRGQLSASRRVVLRFDDSEPALKFLASARAREMAALGPATPDHLLSTKRAPLWLEVQSLTEDAGLRQAVQNGLETYVHAYRAYFERHQWGQAMLDPYPRVVLAPGVGMWTTGRDARGCAIAADVYHHTLQIMEGAEALGGYASVSEREAFEVEYWPLELYKLSLAPPERELAGRVALVTGAAGGIGKVIARRLAAEGAHVVATDLEPIPLQSLVEELTTAFGLNRALACKLDVTEERSVQAAFEQVRLSYGGLDVLVSNAGVAHSAALDELSLQAWERSLAVNATGHFLVAREVLRLFKEQGIGGSVVFVATKNVTAPGKEFGAYSAAKAAEAQLARVLAIEGGPWGVRANVVNPDAVFQGSGLWSREVREQRARAHGIPVEALEEFYSRRRLLRSLVTPEHVAEAVFFFASDRSAATTGAMLAVDGGVAEAFVR